jgi:D-glycero-D-manno-heptose 1,7-bisphosphate phosphatase
VRDPRSGTDESPYLPEDVKLIPAAAAAVRRLRGAGFVLVAVSNQPAAAKGAVTMDALEATAARARELLEVAEAPLDAWRYCWHHPDGCIPELSGPCRCRKPEPGMLLAAAPELGIDLAASWMVGDADTDVAAGRQAGCRTALIEHPGSRHRRRGASGADLVARDLDEVASLIVAADR